MDTSGASSPLIWLNICSALRIDPHGRGALDAANAALENAVGRTTLQRIKEGIEPRTSSLHKIARKLGVPAAQLLSHTHANEDHVEYRFSAIAAAIEERVTISLPPTKIWEDLVLEDIHGQFILTLPDDSLAPGYLPGQHGIWQAGNTAKPGQPVLIALPGGQFVIRIYEARPTGWAGVSQRVGHPTVTPEADGARIVARLRYLDLG